VAGGKHAGLEDDLDNLIKGLTGTPEQQRAKFYERILALANKRDLFFGVVQDMALTRHPEWRSNETLSPAQFAPQLKTRTETAQAQREADQKRQEQEKQEVASSVVMARVSAIRASDSSIDFEAAWSKAMLEMPSLQDYGDISGVKVNPPASTLKPAAPPPVTRPQAPVIVQAHSGPVLIHGDQVGMVCPLYAPAEMERIQRQKG
jgi:hypothetical protein